MKLAHAHGSPYNVNIAITTTFNVHFVFSGRSSNMKLQISLILLGLVLVYAQIRPITRTKQGPPPRSHVYPQQRYPNRVPSVHGVPPSRRRGLPPIHDIPPPSRWGLPPVHGVPPPRRRGLRPVGSSVQVRKHHYKDVPDNYGGVYLHRTPVIRGSRPNGFQPIRRQKPKAHPPVLTRTKSEGFLIGPMRYMPPAQLYTRPITFPPPPPPTTEYYHDTPDVQKEEEEES